jgi:hypothetical protein
MRRSTILLKDHIVIIKHFQHVEVIDVTVPKGKGKDKVVLVLY